MSDDHDPRYADSYDDNRYSNSSRDAYERDAYDRDSLLGEANANRQARGWTWIAWFAILSTVCLIVSLRQAGGRQAPVKLPPLDDTAASMQGLDELHGRAMIGMGELMRQLPGANPDDIKKLVEGDQDVPAEKMDHLALWATGTFGQRLQKIVIVGDISGPDNALHLLSVLSMQLNEEKLVPSAEQRKLQRALSRLYVDYQKKKFDAPTLKDDERLLILSKLGWYGRVALTPPEAPDQVARKAVLEGPLRFCITIFITFGSVLILGLLGLVGYLAFAISAASGTLKFGIKPGTPSSGIYAETFALWLMGFMGAQFALELVPWPQHRLPLLLVIMFGSLSVLIWPVLRGIPFRQVRQDLGLTWGRAGILEPFMGLPGYSMMLPMLFVGAMIMLAIIVLLAISIGPNAGGNESAFDAIQFVPHPAVISFLQGDRWTQIMLILLACVAAPIVEETMFRGVLYRQLRDSTRGFGWLISGVFSAMWMSFIFAVIHPQPPFAIPALMGIALGCSFVREWRDSLWASMVVHAINNGLVFTILLMGSM